MRRYLVVIVHVRQQHVTEVSLTEHNNVVKAFPSDRTDQPFSICVLPWGTRRCWPVANGHGSKSADEDLAIGPVPVTNEIAGSLTPATCFGDLICVIVVYKVDRLTRSLADFAKLVELFDAQGVSFVSVTQQFNTTTSMGRLTLNVLLSFAQFEREVTSERIRDKIATSKRKGLWVGGPLPLGYEMKDGKIAVVEDEAERVRLIYRRYLELSGVNALVRDLRDKDIRTKIRLRATGATHGGIPFERGSLFYLLRNRFYIGEVKYKGESCPASSQRSWKGSFLMQFSRSSPINGPTGIIPKPNP